MHLPIWRSCRQSLLDRGKAGLRNSCLVCEHVLWCAAGGMAGGFFATSIGDKHPFGIEGWRFAFFLIASVSIFTGILTAVRPQNGGPLPMALACREEGYICFGSCVPVTGCLRAIGCLSPCPLVLHTL